MVHMSDHTDRAEFTHQFNLTEGELHMEIQCDYFISKFVRQYVAATYAMTESGTPLFGDV